MRIGLAGSSATLLAVSAPARALHEGETCRLACQVAQQTCDLWYVLSAQRLGAPDTIITPATLTMPKLRAADASQPGAPDGAGLAVGVGE